MNLELNRIIKEIELGLKQLSKAITFLDKFKELKIFCMEGKQYLRSLYRFIKELQKREINDYNTLLHLRYGAGFFRFASQGEVRKIEIGHKENFGVDLIKNKKEAKQVIRVLNKIAPIAKDIEDDITLFINYKVPGVIYK